MQIDEYWNLLQNRICRRCVDGDGTGACRLPADEVCPLYHYLPRIVATVLSVESASIDAYIDMLRNNVCSVCDALDHDAVCRKRNELACALDRYYPLVVEIIESVRESGVRPFAA
ncbi:MAG TPA: hypothetical protein VMW43_02900 [Bacteroidota bacterium]|nr:hypothetical protein [Bacteroidota bacterium]